MHLITQAVLPGEIVFDIGANAGNKADWFAARDVRVIAVEPQPHLAEYLRLRFLGNPLITIVQKGLADTPGVLTMSISPNHVLSTFTDKWKEGRFKTETWDSQVDVEMTTFDKLIEEFGSPRYAKIDVEGFETQVVSGLSRKVGTLSFEFTSELIHEVEEICGRLTKIGYIYFNLSLGESENFVFDKRWVNDAILKDALKRLVEKDTLLWGDVYAA